MHSNYHAPHFDPTVDELETLKQLELGRFMDLPQALKEHLSGRLLDRGLISKNAAGEFIITDSGRQLIRRQTD